MGVPPAVQAIAAGGATVALVLALLAEGMAARVALLGAAVLLAGKLLALVSVPRSFPPFAGLAYLFLWPGLDPLPFQLRVATPGAARAWGVRGLGRLLAGAGLLFLATLPGLPVRFGALLAAAVVVFLVIPGFLDGLAATWRRLGYVVRPLPQLRLEAASLAAFWGVRRDAGPAAARRVRTPLAHARQGGVAVLACFLGRGLLAELLVTLPVGGGHGLPTAYFLLQGVGVLLERGASRGSAGWWPAALRLAWILLPLPLLFPPAFLDAVVTPLLHHLPLLP